MNISIRQIFAVTVSVAVVLFLLFQAGAMTATSVSGDMAISNVLSENHWIWVIPTLLIFGLGFLLGWLLIVEDKTP
jgi:hypothetical protein